MGENSEITAQTSRAIHSEISPQRSRKLEEIKSHLNSHILDVINAALEEKVIPCIKNAAEGGKLAKNKSLEFRSDGPHPENVSQEIQDAQKEFPRLVAMNSNRTNHCRENSVESNQRDDEDGYHTLFSPPSEFLLSEFDCIRVLRWYTKQILGIVVFTSDWLL